ncbi:UDP-N-acetylmuramate dehydrogenase [bacterium]|nr:UDP-N-acetylmuramate dehydrogenase [bacterium]
MIECFENYDLKPHTTFKIGGLAKKVYFPENKEEFIEVLSSLADKAPVVLGGCSNVLISSKGVSNPVIMTSKLDKYEFDEEFLTAQCGVKGGIISKEAQKLGLSGLEFMIGFPGWVGGMIYMNASAHNQAISDIFIEADVYNLNTKKIITLTKEDMKFSYRKSVMQIIPYILINAKFKLIKKDTKLINDLMERNLEFRKTRQPNLSYPNVGSIFRNPTGDSAGRLLDLIGAKEFKSGGAKIWQNHANFIVNTGNATSYDVLKLIKMCYDEIYKDYMIKLIPEIKFIGDMSENEAEIWNTVSKKGLV